MMNDKRPVKVKLGVHMATVSTGWSTSAITFSDQSGDVAPRIVTLVIDRPDDIAYIRERLDQIEAGWRKQLDAIKVTALNG